MGARLRAGAKSPAYDELAVRSRAAPRSRSPALTGVLDIDRVRSPQQLLALQRAAGNRAVASIVKTHLRPLKGPRSVMRDKVDLEARFKDKVQEVADATEKARYRSYLDDFKKIQDLLYDKPRVLGYLQVLSTAEAREDVGAVLSKGERGAWAASQPILLGNTTAFTTVVNRGQMFIDTVAPKHGVHAHRLQWNVISQDIAKGGYKHSAVQLYRESSRQWWRHKGWYMWQQILDTFDQSEFTSPEALTTFILDNANDPRLADLSAGIKAAEDSRRGLRNDRIKHYAKSDHFKQLKGWAESNDAQVLAVKRDDTVKLEDWTYTGFVRAKDAWLTPPAEIEKPHPEQPVPTVAYPPTHDPESRPPI